MNKLKGLFLYLSVLLVMASCHKKNNEVDLKPDINVANDVVIAQSDFTYIFNMIVRAQTNTTFLNDHSAWIDSAWVVYNTDENEFVFQYSGKVCPDSVRRTGRFEVEFDKSFLSSGSSAIVLFDSYYDGYDVINGSDSIVNNGITLGNRMVFTNYIKNSIVTKGLANDAIISWSSEFQYSTNADAFNQPGNIVFIISGAGSGISSKGYRFSASIDSLRDDLGCPWILDGKIGLEIPDAGYPSGTIDFIANDGCSNKMMYTFEGTLIYLWKNAEYLKN